ncbi:MAG: TadE/TadG family type IV pilus assembly protein [Chloroflexota bacterium]
MARQSLGQSLVEMAIVLPVFLLMTMGIFDLGRAVWQGSTLAEVARNGARYAITAPSDCAGIKNAVINSATGVALTTSSVTISEPSGVETSDPVTVSVTATFTPATPLIANAIGESSLTLTRAATMIIEQGSTGSSC